MAKPEVSVIVPTCNRRAMVQEAIAGVLAQQQVSLQLIVVDDGSTDGTWDALVEIAQRLPPGSVMDLLRHQSRRGVAAARNAGVELARAPFIAFLDSDDLWQPLKLRHQLDYMRAHPGCLIMQCDEIWIRDGRQVNPGRRHRKRAGDFFAEALRTCLISPSAVIMHLALVRDLGGFDEDLRAAEDYDLWLRVLAEHPVGLIDDQLVTRRAGHPGQLSATVCAIDRFRILALLKLLANLQLAIAKRAAAGAVLIEKSMVYAQGLSRRGKWEEACFVRSLADHCQQWIDGPDLELSDATLRMRRLVRGSPAS